MKSIVNLFFLLILIFNSNYIYSIEKSQNSENEHIELPKIPICVEGNYSFNENPLFSEVHDNEKAFYYLKIVNNKTSFKKYNTSLITIGLLIAGVGGALWGLAITSSSDDNTYSTDSEAEFLDSSLGGIVFGTGVGIGLGSIYILASGKYKYETPKPISEHFTSTVFYNNVLLNTQKFKLPYNSSISNSKISEFLINSDRRLFSWNNLQNSVLKYNSQFDSHQIQSVQNKTLSELFHRKGEFETTSQYNDRLRIERIKEKELQSEYLQKIKTEKEKYDINKYVLLQEIKEEIKNIEFTKSYDFDISNYNADKQSFSINIAGTEKKIVIPLSEASEFKNNINNYSAQKIFKPTLIGAWKTIRDDFVLINTKTDKIILWEGSLPTYVDTAVENPPILSSSVKLVEPSGEGYLDAEETAIIQITLTNSGKGSAKMTRVSLFQREGTTLYYDVSKTIEEIKPGQSIISEFSINVPANVNDGDVEFTISFLEEQGFEPAPLIFSAEIRAMQNPELQIVDFGVDDANGDGKISKGESADITLRLQNIGQGNAKNVTVTVTENRIENFYIISDKHFEIGDLTSGESKDLIFTISTNNRVKEIVTLDINISEQRPQFSIEDSIILEIEKTQKQLEPIVFSGKNIEKKIEYSNDLSIDIEKNIPQSNKVNENALAIIFGIENYRNVSNVNFAFRDATIMKEYFSKTIGIPEEQIYFRVNDEVTLGEFRKIFSENGWLDKRIIEKETDIYFYYAGHGAPAIKEEKAFLIPFDGDPNYPIQTGYSLETVFENLSKLNANSVTVFLDACFTGANRENEMLLAGARPVSIQLKNNYVNNVTVFSATSNNEISSSYPKNKHGLFSYFLMKGMQGDADSNKDNKLTINELFDYTKSKVSRIAGTLDREQTPQLECLEPEKIIINY